MSWEHEDPSGASVRVGGTQQERDPLGGDAGSSAQTQIPDEGALMSHGSSYSAANPGITYSRDGIRVPADDFMAFAGIDLQDNLTLMEFLAREPRNLDRRMIRSEGIPDLSLLPPLSLAQQLRNQSRSATQKSACADFIDKMLDIVLKGPSVTGNLTKANAGRLLARWARKVLSPQATAHPGHTPSGFKQKYIEGGQNLGAPVHIAGVAGGQLIGDEYLDPRPWGSETGPGGSQTGTQMVKMQFKEDQSQLDLGLARKAAGHTTVAPNWGYDPSRSIDDYIAEKHAELEGDGAGTMVGSVLHKLWDKRGFTRKDARLEISNLLCDW